MFRLWIQCSTDVEYICSVSVVFCWVPLSLAMSMFRLHSILSTFRSVYVSLRLRSVPSTFLSFPPTLCLVPSAMFCLCSIYRSVYIPFVPVTALSALSTFNMIVGYVCWTYLPFWPSGEPMVAKKAKFGLKHHQYMAMGLSYIICLDPQL